MSGPVTGILENMGKVDAEVVEQKLAISWLEPGSWPAKSLAGKPRTTRPRVFEALVEGFSRASYCGVRPHLRGDVDDEEDFAAVVGEGGGFAGDGGDGDGG